MALGRTETVRLLCTPGVGTGTEHRQHGGVADRLCAVVSAPTHGVRRLGLSSRPSIRRTLQFPLWNRTHSRVSPPGRRYCRLLVSVSFGEALTGVVKLIIATTQEGQ